MRPLAPALVAGIALTLLSACSMEGRITDTWVVQGSTDFRTCGFRLSTTKSFSYNCNGDLSNERVGVWEISGETLRITFGQSRVETCALRFDGNFLVLSGDRCSYSARYERLSDRLGRR